MACEGRERRVVFMGLGVAFCLLRAGTNGFTGAPGSVAGAADAARLYARLFDSN